MDQPQWDASMVNSHPTLRFEDLLDKSPWSRKSWFEDQEVRLYLKGRGATFQALAALRHGRGGEILVPAFHCCSMVEPVLRAGYRPKFYAVNCDLSVNVSDLLAQVTNKTAAIMVVNYFGFDTGLSVIQSIRDATTCCVIEDCAHSFLRANPIRLAGSFGDLVVYSFGKLLPTYAGGGLMVRNQSVLGAPTALKHLGMGTSLIALKRLAEEIVENAPDTTIRSVILRLEHARVAIRKWWAGVASDEPVAPTAVESPEYFFDTKMPWFAKYIFNKSDLESVVLSRRRNYMLLDEKLTEYDNLRKVFRSFPKDICPWAYPVLVEERGRYDQLLRSSGVPVYTFGETLHPLLDLMDSRGRDAQYLAERLLLIPIHQNLSIDTIVDFADKANEIFSNPSGKRRAPVHVA